MKYFLIVKASSIGDIIHSFATLEYLHAKFPGCCVDWVVERKYAALVKSHPFVNKVFTVDTYIWRKKWYHKSVWQDIFSFKALLQKCHYEAVFDLQGNIKSALITGLAKAKTKVGFGLKSVPEKPNLLVTTQRFNVRKDLPIQQRYLSLAQNYAQDVHQFKPDSVLLNLTLQEEGELTKLLIPSLQRTKIMIAFGSNWENKQLSEKTLNQFLQKIEKEIDVYFFFMWGNEKEKKKADELMKMFPDSSLSIGCLSFPLWQRLMQKMNYVIAMDSAALHLCGTTNTPSFSVFGPSSASIYKPLGDNHTHVQGICPYNQSFVNRCARLRTCPTGACMKNLEAEILFQQFIKNFRKLKNQSSHSD